MEEEGTNAMEREGGSPLGLQPLDLQWLPVPSNMADYRDIGEILDILEAVLENGERTQLKPHPGEHPGSHPIDIHSSDRGHVSLSLPTFRGHAAGTASRGIASPIR